MTADPPPGPAEPRPEFLTRVAATRSAREQAAAVHDQAIRDAKTAGHPVTRIAGTLGVTNRMRLYAVLDTTPDNDPAEPAPTPVVFLRGAGAPAATWRDIETALHRRGLATVKDRQQAWNLARGGIPVILVDFSANTDTATAGRVKARWKATQRTRPAGQLLPRAERDRLTADDAPWLDTPVTVEDRETELPLVDPTTQAHVTNRPVDPDELARAVITQLSRPATPD
jgi:hypothetical protein